MNESLDYIRKSAHLWRARIDDGGLPVETQAEFERWMAADPRHGEEFAEAEMLWKALGGISYDPSLERPAGVFSLVRTTVRRRSRSIRGGLAAASTVLTATAAAIVLIVVLIDAPEQVAPLPDPVVFETASAQIANVVLEDGSRVTLGARSRLDVVLTATGRRAELLEGAAFFAIAPDANRPFTVTAGAAEVQVIGTVFDLQRKGDSLYVAVEEGAVRVSHPFVVEGVNDSTVDGEWARGADPVLATVALAAGQGVSATRTSGLGNVRVVPAGELGAWRYGQLVYVRATLAEIVDDVNRYAEHPVAIKPAARTLKLSGTFDADDIDGLLATLEAALPVRVERNGNTQIIVIEE